MADAYTFENWQSGIKPPKGWDVADCARDGWTKANIDLFMKTTARPWIAKNADNEKEVMPPETRSPRQIETRPADPQPMPVSGPVTQMRTTEQAETATITNIKTRKKIAVDEAWTSNLLYTDDGKLKPAVMSNWSLYTEHHPEMHGVFAWDAFKMRVMVMRMPPWIKNAAHHEIRPVQDRDYSEVMMWLEQKFQTPKFSAMPAVVQTVAEHNTYDRLTEYLTELEWDRKPRVKNFLSYYFGCEPTVYTEEIGKNWLVSSVARGLKPGCKVDTMPILEGPQGLNKSTAVKALYGAEFFSDNLSDIGTKDAMMEMQGVWGLEVAEMHRFSAAETNAVKKFLSRDTDRFRPPYGRSVIDAPRRVVMTGTINPEGNPYLKDPTGARRFWPVNCIKIDIDALEKDRDQLWAEAVHIFQSGAKWWVDRNDIDVSAAVEFEQEKRTDVDVWVDVIAPLLRGRRQISQLDIFEGIGIPKKDYGWVHSARVGRIMKKLGWTSARDRSGFEDKVMFTNPAYSNDDKPDMKEEIF